MKFELDLLRKAAFLLFGFCLVGVRCYYGVICNYIDSWLKKIDVITLAGIYVAMRACYTNDK